MYQTVGHSGLASIAEALELPLFTHTISGTAVNLEGEYGSREGGAVDGKEKRGEASGTVGDETEDLYELLRKVKVRFLRKRREGELTRWGWGAGCHARGTSRGVRCDPVQLPARAGRACVGPPSCISRGATELSFPGALGWG